MKKLQITSAVTFVSAWLIGLALAASGPKPSDGAHKIASYYATHEHSAMLAHLLIDGIAGAAIIALAVGLRRYLASDSKLTKWMFAAGVAAGITSLLQAVLARRAGAFPRWLATGGLWFAPLLAVSGTAFPLNSSAIHATLELTLIGLLAWVIASTVAVARRTVRATPETAAAVV
jgi:hypothetical protein